ncbi:MAG: DNA-3-methyladenine glycosylase 2 family protein [Rhizobiaceae bacterium]|nr:DNA-3-methyladenine glycosylase 2 family protein [Rhizobiaceae bacterium]
MSDEIPNIARIRNQHNLQQGVDEFVDRFPQLHEMVVQLPEIPLRARSPGFEGLAEIITAQQVSKASAAAIFERTRIAVAPFTAQRLLILGERPLIEAGQSRAKQVALLGLARAIVEDGLNLEGLCELPVDEAIAEMTALKGIGPWSAEVFLLFCAGHTDIFPAGDVALQHVVGEICQLNSRPDAKQTRILANRWAPLRSIAARIFYAHYARIKGRSAI